MSRDCRALRDSRQAKRPTFRNDPFSLPNLGVHTENSSKAIVACSCAPNAIIHVHNYEVACICGGHSDFKRAFPIWIPWITVPHSIVVSVWLTPAITPNNLWGMYHLTISQGRIHLPVLSFSGRMTPPITPRSSQIMS